ncbi:MAG: hypothetical protein ACK55I_10060, partial [bacterium]
FDDHAHRRARRGPQRAVHGRTRMLVQGEHGGRPPVSGCGASGLRADRRDRCSRASRDAPGPPACR